MKRPPDAEGPSLFDYAQQRQDKDAARAKAEHTERDGLGQGG